jgi:ribonuclease BN (tRNA processing enzyme)
VILTVLGSSGGSPTRTSPASGYLVESGGAALWIDAGTGSFMALAERVDPGTLSAVVISHVHVDHCADLFGLYGYLAYGPSGTVPIRVFLPKSAAAHLAAFAGAGSEHVFHTVLDLDEVGRGDERAAGPFRLRFGDAVHSVIGLVTRIEVDGAAMAYSGDTGPGSDLPSIARGTDLLLCEASIAGVRSEQTYPYHLTAAEAGEIAAEAQIGELVVTHFAVGVDPDGAVAEARGTFGGRVRAAEPGMSLTIGES